MATPDGQTSAIGSQRLSRPDLLVANTADHTDPLGDPRFWIIPGLLLSLLALLLLAPGDLADKTRTLLHGLCAQRPSHSFLLGGDVLPFDARMTGIYGGFGTATIYLFARGRFRAARMPSPWMLAVLVLFVSVLAFDGFNALLLDLGRPVFYAPDNRLRLLTGLLAGTALAVTLCFLTATTLWKRLDWTTRTITGPKDLILIAGCQAPFAVLVLGSNGLLYAPVVLFLIAGAIGAVTMLLLSSALLITLRDRSIDEPGDLQIPLAWSLFGSCLVIVLLAAGRYGLEHAAGIPPLT